MKDSLEDNAFDFTPCENVEIAVMGLVIYEMMWYVLAFSSLGADPSVV